MVKIYEIIDCNDLRYIGSTSQYLSTRLCKHRGDKKKGHTISSSLLDLDNCVIKTLEECDENHRKEKESYWINKLECVNTNKLTFNKKSYMNNVYNRSKRGHQAQKDYYHRNKDKKNTYNSQLRKYKKTWGGDTRYDNNLLLIDVNLFI